MAYDLQRRVKTVLRDLVPSGDLAQQIGRDALAINMQAMWAAQPKPDAATSMRECVDRAQAAAHIVDPSHVFAYEPALLEVS